MNFDAPRKLLPAGLALQNVVELPLNAVGRPRPVAPSELPAIVLQALQIRTFEVTIARA